MGCIKYISVKKHRQVIGCFILEGKAEFPTSKPSNLKTKRLLMVICLDAFIDLTNQFPIMSECLFIFVVLSPWERASHCEND